MKAGLWNKIDQEVVHLCCGRKPIGPGEVGVDIRRRPVPAQGLFVQMDALDFLVLKCHAGSLDQGTLIHGPEHFVHARFCALAVTVEQKLRPGGRFVVEFPDVSEKLRVNQMFGAESWVVTEHVSGWTEAMMREVLTRVGFSQVTVNPGRYTRMTAVKR